MSRDLVLATAMGYGPALVRRFVESRPSCSSTITVRRSMPGSRKPGPWL